MSVFKRLGNVARGKVIEIGRSLTDPAPDDDPDEIDPHGPPPRRSSGPTKAAGARKAGPLDDDGKRALLGRLKNEGLLTEEEYAEKLAALAAPPGPRKPKKRTL